MAGHCSLHEMKYRLEVINKVNQITLSRGEREKKSTGRQIVCNVKYFRSFSELGRERERDREKNAHRAKTHLSCNHICLVFTVAPVVSAVSKTAKALPGDKAQLVCNVNSVPQPNVSKSAPADIININPVLYIVHRVAAHAQSVFDNKQFMILNFLAKKLSDTLK